MYVFGVPGQLGQESQATSVSGGARLRWESDGSVSAVVGRKVFDLIVGCWRRIERVGDEGGTFLLPTGGAWLCKTDDAWVLVGERLAGAPAVHLAEAWGELTVEGFGLAEPVASRLLYDGDSVTLPGLKFTYRVPLPPHRRLPDERPAAGLVWVVDGSAKNVLPVLKEVAQWTSVNREFAATVGGIKGWDQKPVMRWLEAQVSREAQTVGSQRTNPKSAQTAAEEELRRAAPRVFERTGDPSNAYVAGMAPTNAETEWEEESPVQEHQEPAVREEQAVREERAIYEDEDAEMREDEPLDEGSDDDPPMVSFGERMEDQPVVRPPPLDLLERRLRESDDRTIGVLLQLRDRLSDLSFRNRALRTIRLPKKRGFDLAYLDALHGSGNADRALRDIAGGRAKPKATLATVGSRVPEEASFETGLKSLDREVRLLEAERGVRDLALGFPLLKGCVAGGRYLQAPLFLFPVRLSIASTQAGRRWVLQYDHEAGGPSVNRTLLMALRHHAELNVPESELEFALAHLAASAKGDAPPEDWMTELALTLRSLGLNVSDVGGPTLTPFPAYKANETPSTPDGVFSLGMHAVVSRFPLADTALTQDYETLAERLLDDPAAPLSYCGELLGHTKSREPEVLPRNAAMEAGLTAIKAADTSQRDVLARVARGRSFAVQGPPGTGKSHTIVNLIAAAVAKGKTVLVCSQKRAALDVIAQRLSVDGLGRLPVLVHDAKQDKKAVFQTLAGRMVGRGHVDPTATTARALEAEVGDLRAHIREAVGWFEDGEAQMGFGPGSAFDAYLQRLEHSGGTGDWPVRDMSLPEAVSPGQAFEDLSRYQATWTRHRTRGPGRPSYSGRTRDDLESFEQTALRALGTVVDDAASDFRGFPISVSWTRALELLSEVDDVRRALALRPKDGDTAWQYATVSADLVQSDGPAPTAATLERLGSDFAALVKACGVATEVLLRQVTWKEASGVGSAWTGELLGEAIKRGKATIEAWAAVMEQTRGAEPLSPPDVWDVMRRDCDDFVAWKAKWYRGFAPSFFRARKAVKRWADVEEVPLEGLDAAATLRARLDAKELADEIRRLDLFTGIPAAEVGALMSAGADAIQARLFGRAREVAALTDVGRLAGGILQAAVWMPGLKGDPLLRDRGDLADEVAARGRSYVFSRAWAELGEAWPAQLDDAAATALGEGLDALTQFPEFGDRLMKGSRALRHWVGDGAEAWIEEALSAGGGAVLRERFAVEVSERFGTHVQDDTLIEQMEERYGSMATQVAEHALEFGDETLAQLPAAFAERRVRDLEAATPELREHTSSESVECREQLWEDLDALHQLNRRYVDRRARERAMPKAGELKRQLGKKRKRWSLRRLVEEFGEGMMALAPVWLCSPETVAAVFPMVPEVFDYVVFDEASQCSMERAATIAYRAKCCVVVGDEQQLPPSSAFATNIDVESEDTDGHETEAVVAFESLLSRASNLGGEAQLRWHYRSRFPELIGFSNAEYYDGRLISSPVPLSGAVKSAVGWVAAGGVWENQTNSAEARIVCDLLWRSLTEHPAKSVGIITFNRKQADAVLDEVDRRRASDMAFEEAYSAAMDKSVDEQPFVRNIENVQGTSGTSSCCPLAMDETRPASCADNSARSRRPVANGD